MKGIVEIKGENVRFDLGTDSAQRQSPTLSPPSCPDRGRPTHYGWRASVTLCYKRKVGAAGGHARQSSPCSPKPTDKTLTDLEGAQPVTGSTPPASLESPPPPSSLPRRRRRRCFYIAIPATVHDAVTPASISLHHSLPPLSGSPSTNPR